MHELPSSVMITIAMTIIAALLITIYLYASQGQAEVFKGAERQQKAMEVGARKGDLLRYVGSEIQGSQLRAFLKTCEGEDIVVYVSNDTATTCYDFRKELFYKYQVGTPVNETPVDSAIKRHDFYQTEESATDHDGSIAQMMENPDADSGRWYIAALDTYKCDAKMQYGKLLYLQFVRQNPT